MNDGADSGLRRPSSAANPKSADRALIALIVLVVRLIMGREYTGVDGVSGSYGTSWAR